MIYTSVIESPLGAIRLSGEKDALTGLWFVGQKYYPSKLESWINKPEYKIFKEVGYWLEDYFSGKKNSYLPRIKPKGTEFQKVIWKTLLEIPYGSITTYGKIAKKVANLRGLCSMSAQAVGGAVGHNPISILIPCHRVVGSNGSLTGYAGGIEKKKVLLNLEKADVTHMKSFKV